MYVSADTHSYTIVAMVSENAWPIFLHRQHILVKKSTKINELLTLNHCKVLTIGLTFNSDSALWCAPN